jgi:polyphosphate kinase
MSHLDSEITTLHVRLATLEEQKRKEIEHASEKEVFPLKTLKDIIDAKRKQIERNNYSKSIPLASFYDREKLEFLEPILNALKNINERLEILEKK